MPRTIGQTTSAISTAMSSSDRTETNASPAPVRGNYAAIPSFPSEWPTIEQANNMAVQAPPIKTGAPNKTEKPSEELKSSPELSNGSQEVFEDNAAVASKAEDATLNSSEAAKAFVTTSPVTSDATQTSSSAWKPYIQSLQSMGACTSAVTPSVSSSMTVISSQVAESRLTSARHDGSATASYKPSRLQENQGPQVQSQSRNNRVVDSKGLTPATTQENWESKGHTSSPTSVATVSISTSAVTTTTNRDLHITPENPFGVIGDVATATTAYQFPPEILARGPSALEAYNDALAEGKTCVKRVPLMLIGQNRSGKTSLKKSLKGIIFNPKEDSTDGIDVDRYHFQVSNDIWMTGKKDEESTSDADAISFEHHAARFVARQVMEMDDRGIGKEKRAGAGSGEFDISDMLMEMQLHESSTGPDPSEPSFREHAHTDIIHEPVLPAGEVLDSTEQTPEDDALVATQVQMPHFEEIANRTETLLQNGWEENGDDIHSLMWDFAGQSVYYVTHPLFLTARAIYLLAYDLSQNPHDKASLVVRQGVYRKIQDNFCLKTNMDYLDFWMTSVASLASQDKENGVEHASEVLPKKLPAVLLVCTHADKPYSGGDPFELANEIFGMLKGKPYGPQLADVFVVDNTKSGSQFECLEVARLREVILAVAKELPHVNEVIPIKWLRYEKCLQSLKNKRHYCISLAQAKRVASEECIINKDGEILTLLNFLHDLRLLIHFDDTPELNDVVVLDPQWLIDVFKNVITVRPYHLEEKQYVDLWCKLEGEGILEEKLLTHVWSSLIPHKETCESLIAIMEKFSLLCPWPLQKGVSCSKQYLVPSMLKSHPPKAISDLIASAQIPSLFLKFETGQVPAGFFPRLVLEFFQWCIDRFPQQAPPRFFNNFARFHILPGKGRSVVLLCHSFSIEFLILTGNDNFDTTDGILARYVRNQLASMIDCMRNKFFWVKNVAFELSFLCPVCCHGRAVNYCDNHHAESCRQEGCLHFFPDSKLGNGIQVCDRSTTAQDIRVSKEQFAPWFSSEDCKQPMCDEYDGRLPSFVKDELPEMSPASPSNIQRFLHPVNQQEVEVANGSAGRLPPFSHESDAKALVLSSGALQTTCDAENVVALLSESLELDEATLADPGPEKTRLIRCLSMEAKSANRLDVVKHLREITPAGTTGPLLPERLDVKHVVQSKLTELTINLCGGEEWKILAEKLGLNSAEILYLDKRTVNPCMELLSYVRSQRLIDVGTLYDALVECGFPVWADIL